MQAHRARVAKRKAEIKAAVEAIDAACEETGAEDGGGGSSDSSDGSDSDSEGELSGDGESQDAYEADLVHFHTPPAKKRRVRGVYQTERLGVRFADEH